MLFAVMQCWFLLSAAILYTATSLSSPAVRGNNNLLILGLGNVGTALFDQAKSESSFDCVRGTKRNPNDIHDDSIIPFTLDEIQPLLSTCTHLLITIPPHPDMTSVMSLVSHHLPLSSWIGVVSTTGVYGNHDGAWITEESELRCHGSSAQQYVEYEQDWATLARPLAIFRCAGLYGPSRSALHTVWKNGRMERNPTTVTTSTTISGITNRIHEYDVARAIMAAMVSKSVGVYNLADDEPENRFIVMEEAAKLLQSIGRELPVKVDNEIPPLTSDISGRGRRRSIETKRISNTRMKENLISELHFPTYRQGLQSILEGNNTPWGVNE